MTRRVTAEEMERAIEHPALGQGSLFRDFEWLTPRLAGAAWVQDSNPRFPTHYLFTRPERFEPLARANQEGKEFEANPYPLTTPDGWQIVRPMQHQPALEQIELVPLRGAEAFEQIAARGDYHEILINSGCGTYDEPHRDGSMRIPCGWTARLARGEDPRPEGGVQRARSVAEIHRCMLQLLGIREPTHRLEYAGDDLVAVYEGPDAYGKLKRMAFELVAPLADPRDYGPGVSQVLCGGMLAYMLDSHLWTLQRNFHRETREALHESTPLILREIDEVLKMLDPATRELGPEHFRHPFAPGFVKHKPHVLTEAWLTDVRRQFVEFLAGDPHARKT